MSCATRPNIPHVDLNRINVAGKGFQLEAYDVDTDESVTIFDGVIFAKAYFIELQDCENSLNPVDNIPPDELIFR